MKKTSLRLGHSVLLVAISLIFGAKPLKAQAEIGPSLCTEMFTSETALDPVNALVPSDYALTLPIGTFFFRAPGQFLDFGDGSAQLVGEVYDQVNPDNAFYVDIRFFGKLEFFDIGFPPPGHPVLGLQPSAYFTMGGPIAPPSWTYFTGAVGAMFGLHNLTGASIQVSDNGSSLQIGEGASNKTLQIGGFVNLDFLTVTQPTTGTPLPTTMSGDFNMTMGNDPAEIGRLHRPGTGEDFRIRTGVFGARPMGGVGFDKKISTEFDLVSVKIESVGGTFVNQQISLGVDCFFECTPSPPTAAGLHHVYINKAYGGFMVIGVGGFIPGPIMLPPAGYTVIASVPPGFSGMNFILQAFCLSPAAANGTYAASDGHIIKIF